jgi:hypothetical protein
MATTYTLISSVTVGAGGAANIDFTSIPQTYTDLLLKVSARSTAAPGVAVDNLLAQYNGVTSSSYSEKGLGGNGSTAYSQSYSRTVVGFGLLNSSNSTANTFGNSEIYIPNYAGSNNKSSSADGVTENNATASWVEMDAGLFSNTAAITSIKLSCSGNFVQYSTAYLYGISNA